MMNLTGSTIITEIQADRAYRISTVLKNDNRSDTLTFLCASPDEIKK
jgi:hypothetical protein